MMESFSLHYWRFYGTKKSTFTWKPESFNTSLEQPNLVDLRTELVEKRPISGSLLIWEKGNESESWWLIDLGHKKIYHLDRSSDTEIAVSEESQDSSTRGWPRPRLDQKVYATAQGFVDWLTMEFKSDLDEYDLERLKRTDLSVNHRSFEIVHPNLLTVHEMFREILTSPSEWAIDCLDNNLQQQIQTNLDEFLKILDTIRYFDSHASSERHKEVLKQTFDLCNKIQQQLQQTVTWLRSKKAEQFDPHTTKRLETQVQGIVDETLEGFREENNLSHESTKEDVAKIQEGVDQLTIKFENELAQESVSEFKEIFAEQAKRHQRAAWGWIGTAGILIIGVVAGIFFYGLLDVLKLEGTEWTVVLQNIFKKGTVLTLFYFALNRSIKNYTAQKHLEIVNRHRENSLGTFTRFVSEAKESRETRDAVLLAATNAIFDANQSGYLSAKAKVPDSANPIQQVMRTVFPGSSTKPED